ncbi:MAG: hypothetical protein AAF153_00645, partial [Pseudomonadota bacterium]
LKNEHDEDWDILCIDDNQGDKTHGGEVFGNLPDLPSQRSTPAKVTINEGVLKQKIEQALGRLDVAHGNILTSANNLPENVKKIVNSIAVQLAGARDNLNHGVSNFPNIQQPIHSALLHLLSIQSLGTLVLRGLGEHEAKVKEGVNYSGFETQNSKQLKNFFKLVNSFYNSLVNTLAMITLRDQNLLATVVKKNDLSKVNLRSRFNATLVGVNGKLNLLGSRWQQIKNALPPGEYVVLTAAQARLKLASNILVEAMHNRLEQRGNLERLTIEIALLLVLINTFKTRINHSDIESVLSTHITGLLNIRDKILAPLLVELYSESAAHVAQDSNELGNANHTGVNEYQQPIGFTAHNYATLSQFRQLHDLGGSNLLRSANSDAGVVAIDPNTTNHFTAGEEVKGTTEADKYR